MASLTRKSLTPRFPQPANRIAAGALAILALAFAIPPGPGQQAPAQRASLFAQSAQRTLSRVRVSYGAGRVAWLLLDAHTGQQLASEWPGAHDPIPLGSLTKPFVALAYARTHRGFPQGIGLATSQPHCASPTLTIEQAIGYSCNEYFLGLARQTDPAAMAAVATQYRLPSPPAPVAPEALIGLRAAWKIAPAQIAAAYLALLVDSKAGPALAGMKIAASQGTAQALHDRGVLARTVLAKTGTATCAGHCVANNDGFVVVLSPAENPRLLLMVERKGTTGAGAAVVAAKMLRALEELHGSP